MWFLITLILVGDTEAFSAIEFFPTYKECKQAEQAAVVGRLNATARCHWNGEP